MTTYDNLITAARGNLEKRNDGDGRVEARATGAIAQATLALAEQQRITNLIALAKGGPGQHSAPLLLEARIALLGDTAYAMPTDADDVPSAEVPVFGGESPVNDDGLTEDERRTVESLPIGHHHDLSGNRLDYRLWVLRDIGKDKNESDAIKALASSEIATYTANGAGA